MLLLLFAQLNASGEVILIDFGNDLSYRGASIASPDGNGNYWNSVHSGAYYANMVDTANNTTTIDFGFGSVGGSDYYNGPAGALQGASNSVYNSVALGNLGVDEAVYDWYKDSTFTIQGLDPMKTYNLTFFGSHKYDVPGISTYTVCTSNDYLTAVASTTLAHNNESINTFEWQHNQDRVATINGVSPQYANSLWIRADGYINAMQIEVIPEPATLGLVAGMGSCILIARRMLLM